MQLQQSDVWFSRRDAMYSSTLQEARPSFLIFMLVWHLLSSKASVNNQHNGHAANCMRFSLFRHVYRASLRLRMWLSRLGISGSLCPGNNNEVNRAMHKNLINTHRRSSHHRSQQEAIHSTHATLVTFKPSAFP